MFILFCVVLDIMDTYALVIIYYIPNLLSRSWYSSTLASLLFKLTLSLKCQELHIYSSMRLFITYQR